MFIFNMKNLIKTLLLLSYAVYLYGVHADDELIFTNSVGIHVYNTTSGNYTTVLKSDTDIVLVDYDFESRTIFYVNHNNDVMLKNLITNEIKVILHYKKASINDMLVDWVAKNIYFYDRDTKLLEVCDFNGKNRYALLTKNLASIRGMALSPKNGYIFMIDGSENPNPKIERVDLDGNNRITLVDTDISMANTIAVDEDNRTVYWHDIATSRVEVISMDGSQRKVIYEGDRFLSIDAFAVLQSKIFFSDYIEIHVFSCDKFNHDLATCEIEINQDIPAIYKYGKNYQKFLNSACHVNNGGCSHLCLNNPTNHTCGCPSGYKLLADKKNCSNVIIKKVFLATRQNLRIVSMDVENKVATELPIENIRGAISVDYDDEDEMVYWTDSADNNYGVIKRATLTGSVVETIIPPGFTIPDHLAIDWIARHVYWSCTHQAKIYVALMDGSATNVVIANGLGKPRGIVVDPKNGKLYFSDWGQNPKIESSDLDGSNREILVNTDIVWPNDLALDYSRQHLYWVDAYYAKIEFLDLVTRKRYQIEENINAPHMFGIAILDDYIYWTDFQTRDLNQLNIKTRQHEVVVGSIANIMGIAASRSTYDYGDNPCKTNRNGCSHFCFYKVGFGGECRCPDSYILDKDKKTCKSAHGYILYSTGSYIKALSLDTVSYTSSVPTIVGKEITLVESDSKRGLVIWVESASNGYGSWSIKSQQLNDSNTMKFIQTGILEPIDGIAVDWISKNIYWSRGYRGVLEVSRLDGSYRRTLIQRKRRIGLISIDPSKRKLFWFEMENEDGHHSYLLSSNLDGTNKKYLHNVTDEAMGLTVDTNSSRIYWVSRYASNIASVLSDGSDYQILVKGLGRPVGLTNFQNLLYVCEQETLKSVYGSIFSVDKQTKEKKSVLGTSNQSQLWFQDLTVMHNDLQTGNNTCAHLNGGCEHLCFSTSSTKHTCMCEMHYSLNEQDKSSCKGPDEFILLSGPLGIQRFSLNHQLAEAPLHFQVPVQVESIEYNIQSETVYWLENNSIRYFTDGEVQTVQLPDKATPFSFAIDFFTNCLFWSDKKFNTIEFMQLDNPEITGVIFQNDKFIPRKILLYPEKGVLIFVNEYLSINDIGLDTIESVHLDGSNLNRIHTFTKKTHGGRNGRYDISIHLESERIFWLHLRSGVVQSNNIFGKDDLKTEIEFYTKEHTPVVVSTYGKYLYWVDFSTTIKFEKLKMKPISISHGKSISTFQGYYEQTNDLLVVDLNRKKQYHPCQVDNGGCSHICYAVQNRYGKMSAQCACPIGYVFVKKGNDVCQLHDNDKCNNVCNDDCKMNKVFCQDIVQCEKKYEELTCICHVGEYRCQSNKCIAMKNMCDGKYDCPSGEDENKRECDLLSGNYTKSNPVVFPTPHVVVRDKGSDLDSKYTAGIISGAILTTLIVLCALYAVCRIHYKKLHHLRKQEKLNQATPTESVYQMTATQPMLTNSNIQKINLQEMDTVRQQSSLGSMLSAFKYDGFNVRYITGSSNATDSTMLPLNPPPSICLSDIGRRSLKNQPDFSTTNYYDQAKEIPAPPATPFYSPSDDSESVLTYKTINNRQPSLVSEQCTRVNCTRCPPNLPRYQAYNNHNTNYNKRMKPSLASSYVSTKRVNPSLASSYVSTKRYERRVRRSSCSSAETLFGKSISRQPSYASGLASDDIDNDPPHMHHMPRMPLPSIASVNSLSRCSSENSVLKLNYEIHDSDSQRDFYNTYAPPPSPGTEYSRNKDIYFESNNELYDEEFHQVSSPLRYSSAAADMNDFNEFNNDNEGERDNDFEVEYLLNSTQHSVNNSVTG